MNRQKHRSRLQSADRSASHSTSTQPKGFAELNPDSMGFDVPSWLDEPAHVDKSAEMSTLSQHDGIAPAPPQDRTVVEGMKVVCICKGIRKRVFWRALDEGICTKEEMNRQTGSGSGGCRGRRCGPRILDMLRQLSK